MKAHLRDTNQQLDQANNEINRLQATLAQVHEGNPNLADSQPTVPLRPVPAPRGSSASRRASTPGARHPTPEPPPSLSPPRRAAVAPTRRMNTKSQVTGDANSRTPPPELFSPQRARRSSAAARTARSSASKPARVSKAKTKKTKTRK
ncbi:hypothetical protein MBLNU13_g02406t1 [Cladosporium sp. NU13]